MIQNQYEDKYIAHNLFIERLNNNNENVIGFITEIEFFITDNSVIDIGGVFDQAISTFVSNFMRKLHKSNEEFIANKNKIYYTFKSKLKTTAGQNVLESFLLGTIFIVLFTSRCPSLEDPSLCTAIFNYAEQISFDFCTKYSNQFDFLNH